MYLSDCGEETPFLLPLIPLHPLTLTFVDVSNVISHSPVDPSLERCDECR